MLVSSKAGIAHSEHLGSIGVIGAILVLFGVNPLRANVVGTLNSMAFVGIQTE